MFEEKDKATLPHHYDSVSPSSDGVLQVIFTLACPCLPVLEVDISTILQGRPLSTT